MKTIFKYIRIGDNFAFEDSPEAEIFTKVDVNLYSPQLGEINDERYMKDFNQVVYRRPDHTILNPNITE